MPALRLGYSGGQDLTLPDGGTISVAALRAAHERFFPAWMESAGLRRQAMAMAASDIEALIKAALPDARVTVEDLAGDGDHYAATVVSEQFRGLPRVQPAPDRLRRAARPHGRRAACARPADLCP